MPLNSAQLADLVNRARRKAPPVSSPLPPPQRSVRLRQAKPAPLAAPATPPPPESLRPAPAAVPPPLPSPAPPPEHTAEAEDFPTGWELRKESWHFHRRFYAIFKRPMHRGEYSSLLHQIRYGRAEHLGEDCWRVTLPGNSRMLPIRATPWRLITILPKNWQPPTSAE
jgi:hypothetical protein